MADGGTFLANHVRVVAQVIAVAMTPPPPIDLHQWAIDNVKFGDESPVKGGYKTDLFPFFRRVLEVLGPDDAAQEVVMMKSAQLGGTVLAQIFLAASLDLDPCYFLYVHPTEPNAERWAKMKWRPMIRQSPRLAAVLPEAKGRDIKNSTLYQERADGRGAVQISGASSPSSLSMLSAKRQVQDDLAKWEPNSAGDPEVQADSRSSAFPDSKIFKISTPLVEPGCRITKAYRQSTQEQYHVPCPHCAHMHPLEWANMQAYIEAHPEDEPCFVCPSCGGLIEEYHRADIVLRGKWVAENPNATRVGFYIWSAYSPVGRGWRSIRDRWLDAKGEPAKEQAFLNDVAGLAFKAHGEAPPWEELSKRADPERRRGLIPIGGLLLVMGLDCQQDRVEWNLMAYGQHFRRWAIDYGKVEGHISDESTQIKLNEILAQTWPDVLGNRRSLNLAAIDGGAWTNDVGAWVKKHPISKVIMVRGVASDLAPPITKVRRDTTKTGKPIKYANRFFNVGVSLMKMSLYQNLKKIDPLARGYCGFPEGLPDDYYQQLCAERRVAKKTKTGFEQFVWTKDPSQRNEVLDTTLYAEAAAVRLGWREMTDEAWARLAAKLEVVPESPQLDIEQLMSPGAAAPETKGAATAATKARRLA